MKNSWCVRRQNSQRTFFVPHNIQRGLVESDLEPGYYGEEYKYFSHFLESNDYLLQTYFQNAFAIACRHNQKRLLWNLLVLLSQFSYEYLDPWGQYIALSATRNPNRDIQEMGIRCFENWENLDALELLHSCRFEEHWLQEYANEVYEENVYVLRKKNQSGQVAGGIHNQSSWVERRGGGYIDNRFENRSQHIVGVAG